VRWVAWLSVVATAACRRRPVGPHNPIRRWRPVAWRLAVLVTLALGPLAAPVGGASPPSPEPSTWIVRLTPGALAGFRRAASATEHVRRVEELPALNMALVVADAVGARALAAAPGVVEVRADAVRRLDAPAPAAPVGLPLAAPLALPLGWNLRAVAADRAWPLGVTGEGVVIAVLDSGADWLNPALRARYRGRLGDHDYNWFDATGPGAAPVPVDPYGHGTQVLGVALGRSADVTYGVAPGAEWIVARAFDDQGRATDSALLRAGAWLLAPTDRAGRQPRPDLAPDIVVCSWVLGSGADPLFEAVLGAWRAAGILPVCAAGNDDLAGGGRVLAPASDPGALAVGASVPGGAPWPRSRRGPGFAAADKPDLLAPGVGILAPVPGGGDMAVDGTSFAAPHVAGAAALARSANPGLTADDLAAFLRHTAHDRGPPGPDPESGWGNLDAAGVAAAALTAGRLAGQLTGPNGAPTRGTVRARSAAGGADWTTDADALGRYDLALPAGAWSVSAGAFGGAAPRQAVHVVGSRTSRLDLVLRPAATGQLAGRVSGAFDGPVEGLAVRSLAGGLDGAVTDQGRYRLTLPTGRQAVRFAADAHRAVTVTVPITADRVTTLDVTLPSAPRALVVDADGGQGERVHPYVVRALADVGVPAAVWPGDAGATDAAPRCAGPVAPPCLPTAAELANYDVVFWVHDTGSPGRLDASAGGHAVARALEGYLLRGGRLVVAGQDVGLNDAPEGAAERRLAPDLYRRVLGAQWLADRPSGQLAEGRGPLAGLTLDLRWPGGAGVGQSWAPDVVAPAVGAEGVEPLLVYPDGEAAGLGVTDQALGKRAYLAFGLQQAGGRVALAALVDRLLGWLQPPELALTAGLRQLAPGASTALTLTLRAGPVVTPIDVALRLPPGLAVRRLPPGMLDTGAGELRWSGRLGAGALRDLPVTVALAGPAGGARPLHVVATTVSWRRPVTATLSLWPTTPDLGASALALVPERLAAGGPVTAVLAVANTGAAPARVAGAKFALPADFEVDAGRATATAGALAWPGPGPTWSGDLQAGQRVTVTLPGRLPAGSGLRPFTVQLNDGTGVLTERVAQVLLAGPDLTPSTLDTPTMPVTPGATVTATLRLVNAGGQAAVVEARLALAPGISYVGRAAPGGGKGTLRWPEPLPPGATLTLPVPLALAPDMASGAAEVKLTLDDGAWPAQPVDLIAALTVRRPDLRFARVVLLPERVRSGDVVTGTVLVANAGDAPALVQADVAVPPTLALDPGPARVSVGTVTGGLGALGWSVDAPPAVGRYAWRVDPVASIDGSAGVPVDPGRPFDLGMPFPLHSTVVTRAMATGDGLLVLGTDAPPAAEQDASGAPAGGGERLPTGVVAPLWRTRRAGGPVPRVRRSATAVTVTWPGDRTDAGFSATLFADGGVAFAYGPGVDGRGARVGVGPGPEGGAAVLVPGDAVVGGQGIAFRPPLAWRWLRFGARAAQGLGPNSVATVSVWLRGPWGALPLTAGVQANSLGLDATTVSASPSVSTPGGQVRYQLTLAATGVGEARGVDAAVDLPDAALLEAGSATPGLDYDAGAGRLTWRGRVAVGAPRTLAWSVRLDPGLPPGGLAHTTVDVLAAGVPRVRRRLDVPVQATDFTGSAKAASRAVASAGDVVTFTLRAAHTGPGRRMVRLTDALPDRLVLVPASLSSTVAPPPRWDAASRSLQWSGELAANEVAEVTVAGRYAGGGAVTNVMRLEDDQGSAAAFWAGVAETAVRLWLPLVRVDRP
jgi:subtilisin family serine protease